MEINNPISYQIWKDRYCKNNETIEQNLRRVAKYCANNEEEEQKFYDVMNKGLFFPAGRTMSNAGIGKTLTLNNCFVLPMIKDDMSDIFDKLKIAALTHKAGGGTGFSFSQLRPKGSPTSNDAIASGAVSFMDVYNAQTATIMQGSRRGANMGVMSIYSMDIEEFITAKSKDPNRLCHFNISVMVDDDFMRAKEKGEDIWLHYPVYNENGQIIKDPSKWLYKKKINAKYLWDLIVKEAYNTGEPGVLFADTMNRDNNLWYIEQIVCTNPCVTGDTLVLTDQGYKPIASLVGQKVRVWNGFEFSEVIPRVTGHNQKMVKVEFSDGSSLTCTIYHRFVLKDGSRVEAKDLKVGDKLAKFNFPVIEGTIELDEKDAYTRGFFSGDGCKANSDTNYNIIPLYDNKKALIPYLDYEKLLYQEKQDNRIVVVLPRKDYDKDFVPDNTFTIKTRLNWLAGLIDADGTLNSEDGGITICSINRGFLDKIRFMLNTMGCHATVALMKKEGLHLLPDSNDNPKEYYTQDCYRLIINASNVRKLMDLGLVTHRVQLIANPNRDASRFIQVTNIEFLDKLEDTVYCLTEPKNNTVVFNGIMTGNCGEYLAGTVYGTNPKTGEKLNPDDYGGACNLGSLFLHNFVKNPFTGDAYFDWDKLQETIKVAVRFLDNIIDKNHYPHRIYENYQKSFRTIGLGVTGLADALCMLGIKYNSRQAIEFVDKLMNFVALNAYLTSIELAKEKGEFPLLDREKFIQSGYLQKHLQIDSRWREVIDGIKQHGIRNARLISVAPTGTLSLVFGNNCSSGIEPIFMLEYDRKIKIGGQDEKNAQIVKMRDYAYDLWLKTENKSVGKDVFITALEMSVEDHVNMLKTVAFHVDMGVSKTINIPEDYSFEQTKKVYDKCWKAGIKGCTIFRPNPIRQGVLISNSSKQQNKQAKKLERGFIINTSDDLLGKKRKLITGCGSLHLLAFFDPDTGDLMETYFAKGSAGGCQSFMVGLSRAISLVARGGIGIEAIIDQLKSTPTCPSYAIRKATKNDTSKGVCCPDAIANALKEMHEEVLYELGLIEIDSEKEIDTITLTDEDKEYIAQYGEIVFAKTTGRCPQCGQSLENIEGCLNCNNCGWSKCG